LRDIPWSTAHTFGTTVARLQAAGLTTRILDRWFDVDTPADLERLARLLDGDPERAPATARVLATLREPPPSSRPWLSVVIPTYQEARVIEATVAMAARIADEVVVADAESPDGTATLAERAGARVVLAPKGRGSQLAAGARAARGDVLLFLHADAHLPPAARGAIARALASPDVVGGNFYLRYQPESRAARLFSWANDLRRRFLRIYYGDTALFVRRSAYLELGGFEPLPLFEDRALIRRLERTGRTAYVRHLAVGVSARRFARAPVTTLARWAALEALYLLGVPPAALARFYADARA
jgi:rSAM/selenodomain-associated transferase 2